MCATFLIKLEIGSTLENLFDFEQQMFQFQQTLDKQTAICLMIVCEHFKGVVDR
jgi:hypothetical protein